MHWPPLGRLGPQRYSREVGLLTAGRDHLPLEDRLARGLDIPSTRYKAWHTGGPWQL